MAVLTSSLPAAHQSPSADYQVFRDELQIIPSDPAPRSNDWVRAQVCVPECTSFRISNKVSKLLRFRIAELTSAAALPRAASCHCPPPLCFLPSARELGQRSSWTPLQAPDRRWKVSKPPPNLRTSAEADLSLHWNEEGLKQHRRSRS